MNFTETDLNILRKLDKVTSQKEIAKEIGFSIGKVNFIIKSLAEKGLLKVEKFALNKNKNQYIYLLTEKGIKEKISLTEQFIQRKKKEYDELQADLEKYKEEEKELMATRSSVVN